MSATSLTAAKFGLTDLPAVLPPLSPRDAIWAGMPELKDKFSAILTEAKTVPRTQFILNWGPWGAGKTHASVYFSPMHWPRPRPPIIAEIIPLHIVMPAEPTAAAALFYRDVVEAIGIDRVRELVRKARADLGDDEVRVRLETLTESRELGLALYLLGDKEKDQLLLNAYLLGSITASKALTLGLARTLSSTRDRFRILGAMFSIMTGLSIDPDIRKHGRVVVWLDEGENMTQLQAREYAPLSQGIRELLDRVPRFLTLFLSFTLAEPEQSYIEQIMGSALIGRVTHQIYFKPPSAAEALGYAKDYFRQMRPEGSSFDDYFPFEETSLRWLIESLSDRTPREVNKAIHNTVVAAEQAGTKPPLDQAFISSLPEGLLQQELP